MGKLFILLSFIFTMTSCQHLIRFVNLTSSVKQTQSEIPQNQKKRLYYTFRVLDKEFNFVYIEQFPDPETFFYRDVSQLQVLDTLQWASETSYYNR